MSNKSRHKTYYEHQSLRLGEDLESGELKSLESLFGKSKDFPYYSLIPRGIKLCEYVGVIQVGKKVIEVLPKIDKNTDPDSGHWQHILIDMLKVVSGFNARAPGYSDLKLKSNTILEMYFEIFINEVEYLVRTGMVRKYHKDESNQNALKGRLIFSKQIQKNLVHQERFFTRNTVYDHEHVWHVILYQAIMLIKKLCKNASLHSRIGQLELTFPKMPGMQISAKTFDRLIYNRQTERYKKAIEIARLLLLNYHPDIRSGHHNVLALMFNMNDLWERFVYCSLRKHLGPKGEYSLSAQKKHPFWVEERHGVQIKPDLEVSNIETKEKWIWDTKWKIPTNGTPSSGDLQQMYTYAGILQSHKVALVYPGTSPQITGTFFNRQSDPPVSCSVIYIPAERSIPKWQENIYECFMAWAKVCELKDSPP